MSGPLPAIDELRRLLYTPVLSDVLDGFGLMHQALRPFVRPIDESLVLLGRVRTGRYQAVSAAPEPGSNPYELEMDLIDDLKPGEVPVLACGGPTDWIAPWGELLSTAARARGAAGCVTAAPPGRSKCPEPSEHVATIRTVQHGRADDIRHAHVALIRG